MGRKLTRKAACHPEKPHVARGLCQACYRRAKAFPAKCHPDKAEVAKGLCRACYAAAWVSKNPGYYKDKYPNRGSQSYERTGRQSYYLSRYRLTQEDLAEEKRKRNNLCDICKLPCDLHVDHNHETGTVRGLLCGSCNRGLGHFKDSPDMLRRAASYLEECAT